MTDFDAPFSDLSRELHSSATDSTDGSEITDDSLTTDDSSVNSQRGTNISSQLASPAFAFDATKQDALYARPETWDLFGDALLDAEIRLRDLGIRDTPKRELHDAALKVLSRHSEEIAEAVAAARRSRE